MMARHLEKTIFIWERTCGLPADSRLQEWIKRIVSGGFGVALAINLVTPFIPRQNLESV